MNLKPQVDINKINVENQTKACQFCKILKESQISEENILYKDEKLFAFHDIDKSSARKHILVCTTEHIESALDLRDKGLLLRMREIGTLLLDQLCQKEQQYSKCYRFGFHLRPYNSIDHIHLHCFVLPFKSFVKGHIVYGKMLTPIEKIIQHIEALPSARL